MYTSTVVTFLTDQFEKFFEKSNLAKVVHFAKKGGIANLSCTKLLCCFDESILSTISQNILQIQ